MGAREWEGLLGTHRGLWIRLEDTLRPPGVRPHARPLPQSWLSAASCSSTAFTLFSAVTPLPQGTETQYLLSLTPLSSPSLLWPSRGCNGSLPPPRPLLRPACPAPPLVPLGSGYFRGFLSFSLLPPPPTPPRRAPASKRGQPRNQRRRLQEGQLETALKRLNFFPQIYTGIKLDTPSSLSKPTPLLFLKVAKRK